MEILKQLNAQRVNIVEADGMLRMALFNSENMAPAMMDGENLLPGHREGTGSAGIIFYNTEGDECGGMGFASAKTPDGGYHSSLSMTFDQYKNDQVVQVSVSEHNGKRRYGYTIYDRLTQHLREAVKTRKLLESDRVSQEEKDREIASFIAKNPIRMQVGKDADGSVAVHIHDSKGRECIRVQLTPAGEPQIIHMTPEGDQRVVFG